MRFRRDINGLRAWAVVAVVLYHFQIAGFSSGFVGVDIFFVISGYLMVRIIVEGHERSSNANARFSVLGFYAARARRIIPALAFLGSALLTLGWFVLTIEEYRSLGSEVLFALTFTSNYKYWLNPESGGGYFADDETLRWLLHSWSLSVEWQFYLILPLIVAITWRMKPGRMATFIVLGAIALLSIGASVLEVYRDAELAFYSIHTRAWQMLAGGFVFFMQSQYSASARTSAIIELLGFSLILTSIFTVQPAQTWPGYHAVVPVLGTMLVLIANRQTSFWTNTSAAQFLGKVSYSLYLWHWPIVETLKYLELLSRWEWVLIGVSLALILSTLSYFLTEKPIRIWVGRRSLFVGLTVVSVVAMLPAVAGSTIRYTSGIQTRAMDETTLALLNAQFDYHPKRNECEEATKTSEYCELGGPIPAIISFGDSHSFAVMSALERSVDTRTQHVVSVSAPGCKILLSAQNINPEAERGCKSFLRRAFSKISEYDSTIPVVITQRISSSLYGRNEEGITRRKPLIYYGDDKKHEVDYEFLREFRRDQISTLCEISASRPTYVLKPIPEMGIHIPKTAARRSHLGLSSDLGIDMETYTRRNEFVIETLEQAAKQCGVKLLDPAQYLCVDGTCWGNKSGEVRYWDDDHLSEAGNQLLVPMFEQIWKDPKTR